MYRRMLLGACSALLSLGWASDSSAADNLIIFGSGDYAAVCGTGTDAAFDSEEAIDAMVRRWKAMGITGVIHRLDLPDLDPDMLIIHPIGNDTPEHRFLHKSISDVQAKVDQPKVIQAAAERHGLEYWGWWPTVYSDGAPSDIPPEELGLDKTNWIHEHRYMYEHPEVITIDRNGKKYYGVAEFAYEIARRSKVEEFEYFAREHGIKNFLVCLRSEASQMQLPARDGDQFGFNQPIVDEMKQLYGVDILTDPRFDIDSPSFDRHDPMLENWRTLRGHYLTQFYRDLRVAMDRIDPDIKIGVQIPGGDYVGPPLGNWQLDWRTWVDEGIVDLLIYGITLEASLDPEAPSKGYLTDAIAQTGLVPVATFRQHIDQSANPDVRLIQPNGNYYFFSDPAPGFDGWRTDAWCVAYNISWNQRWNQWRQDLQDFGHIKYIEENFDEMPTYSECYDGGYGDPRYQPELRRGTGIWTWLGDGTDGRPYAQDTIRRGESGNALHIQGGDYATRWLKARHWSGVDRSMYLFTVSNAISNGTSEMSAWVFRKDDKSEINLSLMNNDHRHVMSVRLAPGGAISYSDGKASTHVDSVTATAGQWQRVAISLDIDQKTFSASLDDAVICQDVPYETDTNAFSMIFIDPGQDPESEAYIDDVAFRWMPELYLPQGTLVAEQREGFEAMQARSVIEKNDAAGHWQIGSGAFLIENNMAEGDSYHCLRASADSRARTTAWRVPAGDSVVVEADVFVRSDRSYIMMVPPAEGLNSASGTTVSLLAGSDVAAAIRANPSTGLWQVWDGQAFVDTESKVQYDIWNSVRLIVSPETKRYEVIVQPIGELPTHIAEAALGATVAEGAKVSLDIVTTDNADHISCYDNVAIQAWVR